MSDLLDLYCQDEEDDCVRAVVSTILQVPTDEFPYLSANDLDPEEFWERWDDELAARGLCLLWFEREYPVKLTQLRQDDCPTSGLWIAAISAPHAGPVARHVIVMKGRRRLHDPGEVPLSPVVIHAAGVIVPRGLADGFIGRSFEYVTAELAA